MGALLASNSANVDASSLVEVLSYTYDSAESTCFIARMSVWSAIGGGQYFPRIFINDFEILPAYPVAVESGSEGFIVNTKLNPVLPGDVVSLRLLGLPADTNIHVESFLIEQKTQLSDEEMDEIADSIKASLKQVSISPERTILSPIKPCTRTFLLPRR